MRPRLPWAFDQSRVWYDLGLREATVVTVDYVNSRQADGDRPDLPGPDLRRGGGARRAHQAATEPDLLLHHPAPNPDREPESAAAIRRVFSYHHLEEAGLDPDVARTAELLRSAPHVAFHVRRGDYLHHDPGGWHAERSHYIEAIGLPHRDRAQDQRLRRGGVLRRPRLRRGAHGPTTGSTE